MGRPRLPVLHPPELLQQQQGGGPLVAEPLVQCPGTGGSGDGAHRDYSGVSRPTVILTGNDGEVTVVTSMESRQDSAFGLPAWR